MRTIWKFPLPTAGGGPVITAPVEMPEGAIIRHFGLQDGRATIWAEVDTDAPKETRSFVTLGTGHPVERVGAYVGSYGYGPFVWHLYEAAPPEWTEWQGGDGPPEGTYGKVVDITTLAPLAGCDELVWTGPADAADWSTPCRYRFAAEQPDLPL